MMVANIVLGKPEAPGTPNITMIGEDFVNLSWERPKNDGGGKILGYIIEKREQGMEVWQKCNQSPVPQSIFNVANLIEGRQYEFRVFAVNNAGISQPSSNTNIITVKAPEGM